MLRMDACEGESAEWYLFGLKPLEGYAAALAVAGSVRHLSRWHWQGFDAFVR